MTIKNKYKLGLIITITLAVILFIIFLFKAYRIDRAMKKDLLATEIVEEIFLHNLSTSDYLLTNLKRAFIQSKAKYDSLEKLLSSGDMEFGEDKDSMNRLKKNYTKSNDIFRDILELDKNRGAYRKENYEERRGILISQFLVNSQLMISSALSLSSSVKSDIERTRKISDYIELIILIVLITAVIVPFHYVIWSIVKSIIYLQKGAMIISEGNLSYRTNITKDDEIGGLSSTFDNMVKQLELNTKSLKQEIDINKSLARLSELLIKKAPLNDISSTVLKHAQELTLSQYGFTGYIDPETDFLVVPTLSEKIWDKCNVKNKGIIFEKFTGLWGWVLVNKKSLLTNKPQDDQRSVGTPEGHIKITRFLSAPSIIGETLVGQVAVANSERDYNERDLTIIKRMASVYALAIEQRRKEDELHDYQTSLAEKVRERTHELTATNKELEREINIRMRIEGNLNELNKNLETRVKKEVEERRKKEQMLIQQSRIAAMGEMMGAIAHQWRQPLNAVSIILFGIKEAYEYNELNADYMEDTMQQAKIQLEYMSKTIDDFRNYFKPAKEKVLFQIKRTAYEVLSMYFQQLRNSSIACSLNCLTHNESFDNFLNKPSLCEDMEIRGFPNELKQVLLNLIHNARDAIIEMRQKDTTNVEKGMISINVDKDNGYVYISIRDNGGGVPEEIKDRIFDPYFSSKEEGKGTGIGLYMSKVIVEESLKGSLTVQNIEKGAEFTIKLSC